MKDTIKASAVTKTMERIIPIAQQYELDTETGLMALTEAFVEGFIYCMKEAEYGE